MHPHTHCVIHQIVFLGHIGENLVHWKQRRVLFHVITDSPFFSFSASSTSVNPKCVFFCNSAAELNCCTLTKRLVLGTCVRTFTALFILEIWNFLQILRVIWHFCVKWSFVRNKCTFLLGKLVRRRKLAVKRWTLYFWENWIGKEVAVIIYGWFYFKKSRVWKIKLNSDWDLWNFSERLLA